MKRDSTYIYIETESSTTLIPFTNGVPDFSGINEPTLSVLMDAYEADKDNIEIIPDPVPIPEIIKPDWDGLGARVLAGDLYPLFVRVNMETDTVSKLQAATHINFAVLSVRDEYALAAGIAMLINAGFTFTAEEKVLWNNTLDQEGFSNVAKIN